MICAGGCRGTGVVEWGIIMPRTKRPEYAGSKGPCPTCRRADATAIAKWDRERTWPPTALHYTTPQAPGVGAAQGR